MGTTRTRKATEGRGGGDLPARQRLPWTALTAELEQAAERSVDAVDELLQRRLPWLLRQMELDRDSAGLVDLWDRSRNHDELARAGIVHPRVLRALERRLGVPAEARGRIAHAGLLHSYGYLFSNLATPYGRKRRRWVEPGLERAMGLTRPTLRPAPAAGSLLGNLSVLLARVALPKEGASARTRRALADRVAPEARDWPGPARRWRMVEEAEDPGLPGLITDLLELRPPPSSRVAGLLVYSLARGEQARLVTAFPLKARSLRAQLEKACGRDIEGLRPQYNAVVDGWPDTGLPGTRRRRELSPRLPR